MTNTAITTIIRHTDPNLIHPTFDEYDGYWALVRVDGYDQNHEVIVTIDGGEDAADEFQADTVEVVTGRRLDGVGASCLIRPESWMVYDALCEADKVVDATERALEEARHEHAKAATISIHLCEAYERLVAAEAAAR